MSTLDRIGKLFYMVDRNATTFERPEEVPKFINEAIPVFMVMLISEWLVCMVTGRGRVRAGDVVTSSGHGLLYETSKIVAQWGELSLYQWFYQFRLVDLDWAAPGTWWMAAIGADFGFYWYHRATHEVNIIWAAHQVHHSSQDYNMSTALRQSVLQRFFALPAYVPMALFGVPFPALLVHFQLNLLYQFWIHTELVGTLGPLEWVLNTPSHHRVHHGANKWCLDKNYGGVLIVWDRIFGTFAAERREGEDKEEIAYGLVDQPQSFNTLWQQLYYFRAVIAKARGMTSWGDSFRALFYGPGWFPGAPRLGDPNSFPDVRAPRPLYDPKLSFWAEVYLAVQHFLTLMIQQLLIVNFVILSWPVVAIHVAFIITTLGVIGASYDGRWWVPSVDLGRCLAFLTYARFYGPVTPWPALDLSLKLCLLASGFLQVTNIGAQLRGSGDKDKTD